MGQETTLQLPLEIQVVRFTSRGPAAERGRGRCKGCTGARRSAGPFEAGWRSPAKLKLVLWGHYGTKESPWHKKIWLSGDTTWQTCLHFSSWDVSAKQMLLPAAPLPCSAAATIAQAIGTSAESISEIIATTAEKRLCSLVEIKAFSTVGTLVLYHPEVI